MQHCAHVGKPSLAGLVWKTGGVSESSVPSPSYMPYRIQSTASFSVNLPLLEILSNSSPPTASSNAR